MTKKKRNKCGDCAFFQTQKCDVPNTLKDDDACSDFHAKHIMGCYFDDKKFVPKLLADDIMTSEYFITFIGSKEIYVWREGYFQPLGEVVIEQHCKDLLQDEFRKNRFGEVAEYIRASTFVNIDEPVRPLVNVENGVLNIETGELKPHNPEYLFFNKLNVKYDPTCKGEKIHGFLGEITGSEEDVKVLEEAIGYCLYRSYPYHKALALVGEGANGKSTFLGLVKNFLGIENVSGKGLVDLESNRFAKASLFGKLANIYADLSDDTLQRTGTFKMLTGGDVIEAEKKFRDSFTFVNYAKLLFSCNKLPEVYDNTDAFFRRWIIIVFPKVFKGDNCDPNILEKLTTPGELSGLLNIALEGLKRILENDGFSYSKSTEETREDYIRKSDPLAAFVMDCLEENQSATLLKQPLYSLFAFYCRINSLPAVNKDTFFKNISKHVTVTQVRLNRKDVPGRPYAFRGIGFTEEGKKLWSRQSNQSTLFPILIEQEENNARNNKIGKTLDSSDWLDQKSILTSVKSWCLANRNERSEISLHALAKFIEYELKENSQRVIQVAFNQAILMPSSKIGMAVVV
jgi:P4 family phage/plasmid primase-like protien